MRKSILMTLAALFIAGWVGAEQKTIYTIEDAYIKSDETEVNFGDEETLWARDATYMLQSYIKFDTSALGTVTNIDAISGYAYNISYDRTAAVYLMTNSTYTTWSENSITWSNAPGNNLSTRYLADGAGLLVGTIATPTVNGFLDVTWDDAGSEAAVIDAMNSQEDITLVLVRPGDRYAKFASKESTDESAGPFQIVFDEIPVSVTSATTLVVSQDARIKPDENSDINFGLLDDVTANETDKSYIQFDSPSNTVVDITSLSAFAFEKSRPRSGDLYLITEEVLWNQSTITWNNAPANDTASQYPDLSKATRIGTFAAPAVSTAETVSFSFVDTTSKQLLVNRMNEFEKITMVLVRPTDRSVSYASSETIIEGAHPVQMELVVEGASPETPYEDWADLFGGADLIGAADSDYDGDHVSNLGEYALNGNPTNALDKGQTAILVEGATFNYVHAKNTNDSNLVYRLIDTSDLVSFASAGTNNWDSQSVGPGTGDYVMITNHYLMTSDVLFLNLEVER